MVPGDARWSQVISGSHVVTGGKRDWEFLFQQFGRFQFQYQKSHEKQQFLINQSVAMVALVALVSPVALCALVASVTLVALMASMRIPYMVHISFTFTPPFLRLCSDSNPPVIRLSPTSDIHHPSLSILSRDSYNGSNVPSALGPV